MLDNKYDYHSSEKKWQDFWQEKGVYKFDRENQTKPIYQGLKKKKFNEKHIYVLNDVKEAFPLIEKLQDKETYVLLENDLPDMFNEK